MPEVSIIVRTKNEERWIGHCLAAIYRQTFTDFEVILVDNCSTDHTVHVAQRYPIAKIVNIEQFRPGRALNEGIRASSGRYLVCLSAHCIPKDDSWLSSLRGNFDDDERLAGVYGRQLPLSFTDPVDKRDLLIVFGRDRRIQEKDYFFHNANSMLRRDVWERIPFDEAVTNIEDRVWGKDVIEAGYRLAYDPEAAVFHHHGLHQGNSPQRARGVVSIIEKLDHEIVNELPESLQPERANIAAVLPVRELPAPGTYPYSLLVRSIHELKSSRYVNSVYIVGGEERFAFEQSVSWIDRSRIEDSQALGLDELLQKALERVEAQGDYPEAMLYVNYDYVDRPSGLFDALIGDAQYKGYDTVFPGYVDFGHYWVKNDVGDYAQVDSSMKGRDEREPVFRALYGLGCVTSSVLLRQGRMVGGKVGIFPVENFAHTVRLRELGDGREVSSQDVLVTGRGEVNVKVNV